MSPVFAAKGKRMTEHNASTIVQAPIHQVYALFTHFNDFPKFMHFVKEVTNIDERRTHWVVHVLRDYEWVAIHEDWIPDQQIGWRSVSGLKNNGRVKFHELGSNRTMVDVYISYVPPSGPIGSLVDTFSMSEYFATILQQDLYNFAHMVEQAPVGALDPMLSHYLFHPTSAFARGMLTPRQKAAMEQDPRMHPQALAKRKERIEQESSERQRMLEELAASKRRQLELEMALLRQQRELLAREVERRLQEEQARREELERGAQRRSVDPVYDTLGGRHAGLDRTAAGDRDGLRIRFRGYEQDPMRARYPLKERTTRKLEETEEAERVEEEIKQESPWWLSIRGAPLSPPPAE